MEYHGDKKSEEQMLEKKNQWNLAVWTRIRRTLIHLLSLLDLHVQMERK